MKAQTAESPNLDLLRAVAVLCVFGSHLILTLTPGHHLRDTVHTPGVEILYGIGNAGVLLFFVHTSLVLLYSLERAGSASLFVNFYIRRFFRIYPLSVFCILAVLLLRIPFAPELEFAQPDWRVVVSNLLLIQNLTHTPDIISPLWTLPREVQMYAVLPLIFVLLRWIGSVPLVLVLWWVAAIAAPHAPLLAYVPCFLGGVFAYQIGREKTYRLAAFAWPVLLLMLVCFYLWFRLNIAADYRPDYALCMIAGALIPNFADLGSSWLTRACHLIARYSYGIYLFHLPLIWFAFVKLRMLPSWLQWGSLAILMCAVPWAAYTWLEAPLIEAGRRLAKRWVNQRGLSPARSAPLPILPASAASERVSPQA